MTDWAQRMMAAAVLGVMTSSGAAAGAANTQPAAPALPAWIAGCWAGEVSGERVHERWIAAGATTMLGVSHTVKGDALSAFEFLRIVVRNGSVVYLAQPGGRPPTEFTAVSQTGSEITFENPAHDYPRRIGYRRVGATNLTAWIDGGTDGSRPRVEYPMVRARCD